MDVHSYDEGWMELEILLSWKQYDILSWRNRRIYEAKKTVVAVRFRQRSGSRLEFM